MNDLVKIFKALCDETRLKIVQFLIDEEKCVCEIVKFTGKSQPTVSIHLSKLENMGILESRREGKRVYYKIVNTVVKKILSKLDFSKWYDIDRKKIDWYPTIDESKCIGCGMCLVTCGRNVFEYDVSKSKTFVKNKFNCMVGCDNCRVYCPSGAISFPHQNRREFIQSLLEKYGIIAKVKKGLLNEIR